MQKNNQKIIPFLWFDDQAEEAVDFYIAGFEDSNKGRHTYYSEVGQEQHQREVGSVMSVDFELAGYQMVALNGGPLFKFNPSISFFVICRSEQEVQAYWEHFSEEGEILLPLESYDWSPRYGWLRDKYGLSWQFMLEEPAVSSDDIIPLIFFTGRQHGQSEAAIKFYTSVFGGAEIEGIMYYGSENEYAQGMVQHAQFVLEGQSFMTMDSGVQNDFPFNEAISFLIKCENQEEIDYYWQKLTDGGEEQPCGWLKDRFGVSWQVSPKNLDELLGDGISPVSKKVLEAFFAMKKIEIETLGDARSKNRR